MFYSLGCRAEIWASGMFLKEGSGVGTSNPCQGNSAGTGDASERTLDEPVLQGTTLVDLLQAFKNITVMTEIAIMDLLEPAGASLLKE